MFKQIALVDINSVLNHRPLHAQKSLFSYSHPVLFESRKSVTWEHQQGRKKTALHPSDAIGSFFSRDAV